MNHYTAGHSTRFHLLRILAQSSLILLIGLLLMPVAWAKTHCSFPLAQTNVGAQGDKDVRVLEPSKAIDREMAGGQTHTYQITLQAGQFLHVIVEQQGIDVAVALAAPDGQQITEVNLSTGTYGREPLSHEVVISGDYKVVVRTIAATAPKGIYQVRSDVKTAATAQDKQRSSAEQLLAEVLKLNQQGAAAAQPMLEKGQQALAIWRELADSYWEGRALHLIGNAYLFVGKYDQARSHYEQALQLYREVKNRIGEGNILINLGNVHYSLGRYEQARTYYEQSLLIHREVKNLEGEGNALNALRSASQALNQYEKVIAYNEQLLAVYREAKNRIGEATALSNLGTAYQVLNRYEKAIESHEQALAIYREIKNRIEEANTLNNLGITYKGMSRFEKAIEYYEPAIAIYREVKDRAGEGRALANLGSAYFYLSRFEKAIEYGEQALAIIREVKNRLQEGSILSNLGGVYQFISRYEKAVECYEQALAISREVKDRAGEARSLGNLGVTYVWLSQYEKAIECYEQALPIHREVKDRLGEGTALNNLGLAYSGLGQYEKAIAYYEQALPIRREVHRAGEGGTLIGLGIAYAKLKQYQKAIAYYEQALAITREVKDRAGEENTLGSLGSAYYDLGRYEQAILYHEQQLQISREIKVPIDEAEALNNLMLDWKARTQPRLAIFFGKQSVNIYQAIRSDIRSLDQESQRSFLKSKEETYRELADLLIAQSRLPEAEQVIKLLKEEEYFEFIRRDSAASGAAGRSTLTPEETALEKRYREIGDQLTALGAERGALLEKKSRTPEEEQRLTKLEGDLLVAGQHFQKFLTQLADEMSHSVEASAKVYNLRESQGLMEDLRELGAGTVALYTLVGEEKYRVILTTPDVQKGFEYTIKAADLNRKVLAFREVLQNPKLDPLPLAQELYQILLGPVAADLKAAKAQTLMWSLDGVLRYLPMAALHDGQQYLIERYRNVVFTPASNARLKDAPSKQWQALGLGVTKAHGDQIPALPGVADEMRGIIREAGQDTKNGILPGTIKLDEAFTEAAMLTGLRQRLPVVHIASHFQFQPGNETDSALLLGDGSLLNLAKIKSLPNVFGGVELLTLSACNTATGSSGANGKEVEGFSVLAQRQGAKAVVASLWPVSDRSTVMLMQEFYRVREAKVGTTKAEAMRQAQIKLLRGETSSSKSEEKDRGLGLKKDASAKPQPFTPDPKRPYAHPYYWAPFILIGNWK